MDTSVHTGSTCSRLGSVGAFCMKQMAGNTRVKLKWTPGNKNSGAISGHDGVTCSRLGSVGEFC